jgi:exonuclease VII small subunit|tara:strand:+ start:2413 stop:2625 length:213 start_codon:yes stop_codon:yes gene_type:complete
MNSEKNSKDINSKSIRETKEEINKILQKLENENTNLRETTNDYDRLLKLNKHMDDLFKKRLKQISKNSKK